MFDRRQDGARRSGRRLFLPDVWIHLVELPHLAQRAPPEIAVSRSPQIVASYTLDPARRIEARGHLMGQPLVLHEAVLASRLNGLLVQTHGISIAPFEAGDLGQDQCVLVAESRWIVVGPLAQLFPVRRQEVAPPVLLVVRSLLIEGRYRQRRVVKVVDQVGLNY